MILLHFGFHEGTTGVHFADALPRNTTQAVGVRALGQGKNIDLLRCGEPSGYLWIDSGIASYPLNTHAARFTTAGYLIDVHLHTATSLRMAALFDVVFVAQLDYVDEFRAVNPHTFWLPLAAPASFTRTTREPSLQLGFVGNARPGSRRERLLDALAGEFELNDWRQQHSVAEMSDIYRRSRVVVNDPVNRDVNMRFFEAMASGAVVVTPQLSNGMSELASVDEHFIVADFDDTPSVIESVRRLLDDPRSQEIGMRARQLAADQHTYDHRAATVVSVMSQADRDAPIRSMSAEDRAKHLGHLAEALASPGIAKRALMSHTTRETISAAARAHLKAAKRAAIAWRNG